MNTLTKLEGDTLAQIARTGGVMLHLQTGRVQAAVRRLIAKGRASVDANGRVTAHRPRHYHMADLVCSAVELGGNWSRATVTLRDGDTVWHPYSTKKHFTGAGVWTFLFHPSSAELETSPETRREVYLPR